MSDDPLSYNFKSLAKLFGRRGQLSENGLTYALQEVYIVGLKDGYAAGLIKEHDLDFMITAVRLVGAPFTCGEQYGKDR